jgi:hypothetical protein
MKAITVATLIVATMAGMSFSQAAGFYNGKGKVCIQVTKGSDQYDCKYASLQQCVTEGKPNGQQCQPNPNLGTTGMKAKK